MSGSVLRGDAIPEDVRELATETDTKLSADERETAMTFPKKDDTGAVFSEVPTIIRWTQSIEEASFQWIRVNDSGAIVAATAQIPKGIIKLQGNARKSDTHSQMVTYGPLHDD